MSFFSRAWKLWMRFGLFLGDIFGRIVLTLFYFTIYLPFGLVVRLFGDPLAIRGGLPTWTLRETTTRELGDERRLS